MRRYLSAWLLLATAASAADYHVGPSQTYAETGSVPWSTLSAGDRVLIHYRSEPYRNLITISRSGAPGNPIQVMGVSGPAGEKPILSAKDAVAGPNLGVLYQRSSVALGVITIAGSAYGAKVSYVEVSNLGLRDAGLESFYSDPLAVGALSSDISETATSIPVAVVGTFLTAPFLARIGAEQVQVTAKSGASLTVTRGYNGTAAVSHSAGDAVFIQYARSAAGMYVYYGDHITLKDCLIDANGNGFFVNSPVFVSSNILITGNTFTNNGAVGSDKQHSSYTEANGVIFEYNSYLQQKVGSIGISLKDRSAGTIIRYNYIECGTYCLNLVECENAVSICDLPTYRETFVYGNVLVNKHSVNGQNSARSFLLYGYDGTASHDRAGTLYLYHNTFIEAANDQYYGYLAKVANLTADVLDIRNNLFYKIATSTTILDWVLNGTANFGVNWNSPSIGVAYSTPVTASGTTSLFSDSVNAPGFIDYAGGNYRLTSGSSARGEATALAAAVTANSLGLDLTPTMQLGPAARPSRADLGAFEYISPIPPLSITTATMPAATFSQDYAQEVSATGGVPPYGWEITTGSLPVGLSIDASTGTIFGSPAAIGSAAFSVKVTAGAQSVVKQFGINVAPPLGALNSRQILGLVVNASGIASESQPIVSLGSRLAPNCFPTTTAGSYFMAANVDQVAPFRNGILAGDFTVRPTTQGEFLVEGQVLELPSPTAGETVVCQVIRR